MRLDKYLKVSEIEAIEYFTLELKGFVTKKNAIYFPYEKALPIELIEKIAKWCLSE